MLIAIALALVGAWSNMLFILIIAFNTLIGIAQEIRAKHMLDKLSLLSVPTAKVVRDGAPLRAVGPGAGGGRTSSSWTPPRQVCSDSVILSGQVEVNESLLTGESDPIFKSVGDHLLSGSFIISGRCRACVEHVGMENYASKLAHEAKQQRGGTV